ncbi:hypothetical protein CTEN210_00863 [Chaetoceros tenuissimus]|uniref:Uncharacterized protein n=1 Tax=Chaetoceros tenuissimus TaxID=426638 RepID=A0AAD3GZJ4_9STRA|nr:hypothetical protein CTEN210_00863 [Chaetoceros tenuissimus]
MKTQALLCVFAVGIAVSFTPTHEKVAPSVTPSTVESNEAPDLSLTPPRKIFLMVEPTPFTYVCGYTNRFNEMLRYLSKAKDHVVILTTDSVTPKEELPKEKYGYTIIQRDLLYLFMNK